MDLKGSETLFRTTRMLRYSYNDYSRREWMIRDSNYVIPLTNKYTNVLVKTFIVNCASVILVEFSVNVSLMYYWLYKYTLNVY